MNAPPDCTAALRMLSDLIAGDLDERSQETLAEHLEQCEACRARAVAMYQQDRLLVEVGAPSRMSELQQRIHTQLEHAPPVKIKTPARRLRTVRLKRLKRGRNSFAVPAAVAAAIMLALLAVFAFRNNGESDAAPLAKLVSFSGTPVVTRNGETLATRENLALAAGDAISVPSGGKATIKYVDESTQLDADSATVFRLEPSEKGKRVALDSGSLSAEVAPQKSRTTFTIKTPGARAEVIGTRYRLSASSAETRLDVTQGRVRLVRTADGAQVEVGAEQYAIAKEGAPLLALALNPPLPTNPKPEQIKKLVTVAEQKQLQGVAQTKARTVQETLQKFTAQYFKNGRGGIPYRLFSPTGQPNDAKLPLVVFFHGLGAAGKDNLKQLTDQPLAACLFALPENQEKHPCYVLAPQIPTGWESDQHLLALDLIDELIKSLPIDGKRVYVTGVSTGGNAVFLMLQQRPNQFAAGIPMAGWMPDPKLGKSYAHVPIWMFHGNADTQVNIETSRTAYRVLSGLGADVRFHEYDKAGHGIFTDASCTPDLVEWTFARFNTR